MVIALIVLLLHGGAPEAPQFAKASLQECSVIDAAFGNLGKGAVAVSPEQIMPLSYPEADQIYKIGAPSIAVGTQPVELSGCAFSHPLRDPINPADSSSLIVSRASIDEAAGQAVMLFDHSCGLGGAIRLTRDQDGVWVRKAPSILWEHTCDDLVIRRQ